MSDRLNDWAVSVMRATSIALVALVPVQIMSWLMVSDPTEHTAQWVADRWSNSAWRALDWVVLVVAIVHGGLGLVRWLAAGDRSHRWRPIAIGFVLAASATLLVLGSYTMFTFEIV